MEKAHVLALALDDTGPTLNGKGSEYAKPGADSPAEVDGASSLVYRRIRRQIVARGLARKYGDGKAKEHSEGTPKTRYQRQIAIVEAYQRKQPRQKQQEGDSAQSGGHAKSSTAIPVVSSGMLPKKTSLRQLPPPQVSSVSSNQQENDEPALHVDVNLSLSSPRLEDIIAYASMATQSPKKGILTTEKPASRSKTIASSLQRSHSQSSLDKSTAQVLCELQITKYIMMREHLVEQVHQIAAMVNAFATELYLMGQNRAKPEAPTSDAGRTSPSPGGQRASSLLLSPMSMRRPGSAASERAAAAREAAMREEERKAWQERYDNVSWKAQQRYKQLHRLVCDLQLTTVEIVVGIAEWRSYKARRTTLTNYETLHRFAWTKRKIRNYMIQLDSDLRDLFPSAAMALLVGLDATYTPLLLPWKILFELGITDQAFVSTTFLTERTHSVEEQRTMEMRRSPQKQQRALYSALKAAVAGNMPPDDDLNQRIGAEKLRLCLERIQHEHELEARDQLRRIADAERLAVAYNPFETIKHAGGVENTLNQLITEQQPLVQDLATKLRHRQEDTNRVREGPTSGDTSYSQDHEQRAERQPLYVNRRRLRRLLDQQREEREVTAECEAQQVGGRSKNKLQGHLLVRKVNQRRLEHIHARKIQRQFRVYRCRTQLLAGLTRFVTKSRAQIVQIQSLFRGYRVKKQYRIEKKHRDEARRRVLAARRIWYTYKRYKRRLRHRHSMSVEAVAQIQLLQVIHQHAHDTDDDGDTVERYRRVGEQRRKQRAVLLQRRQQELLALDIQRHAAAVRIQSVFRMYAARLLAHQLRGERKAHLTAVSVMMIQSKIRRFLHHQEKRRQRFRSDLERVNRSAVRIQSIFRGYNSRASIISQLDERLPHQTPLLRAVETIQDDEDSEEEDDQEEHHEKTDEEASYRLPLLPRAPSKTQEDEDHDDEAHDGLHVMMAIAASPPKTSLPPLRPRLSQAVTPVPPVKKRPSLVRQSSSNGSTRVELKLKEGTIGDDLQVSNTPPVPMRRRLSGGRERKETNY
ncbi:hypothetical protein Poli38472_006776 [Pythium oligandrum]|uniref:Uncharacterized protein n=1 Tax=Pythium oligandrum TaxID=41045 RepID=A0A8K1C569_PYTOL|nr:hypothetical protein Poli38472_006776 [Pythium oligandrum]|eukprot:TMW56766.1 hypothetical protein Poli38472_006776 [Pythium oligandrum]